jgi:hypothetical protein
LRKILNYFLPSSFPSYLVAKNGNKERFKTFTSMANHIYSAILNIIITKAC